MRIWSYQHPEVLVHLTRSGTYRSSWDHIDENWQPAYRWISEQLQALGRSPGTRPPVWGWHSCGGWQRPPSRDVMTDLLSAAELDRGVVLFELEVPAEHVALSWYSHWNELLDRFLTEGPPPTRLETRQLFAVTEEHFRSLEDSNEELVQACLPRIEASWVRSAENPTP